jgi:thiazole/oxazole-forming peptide maturase SagD family component
MAVDDDAAKARQRAVSESIERYCAAAVPPDLPLARPLDLEGPYLAASRFGSISPNRNEEDCFVRWVRAHSLTGNRPIWVPASAVYVPYSSFDDELIIHPQCSVGLAAHTDLSAAVRGGFLEVMERDTTLRAWRFGLPAEALPCQPPVNLDGLRLVRVPCETGLHVVVSLIERSDVPFASSGLAARLTLDDAIRHAVFEAVLSRLWLREWLAENGPMPTLGPVRTMIDNAVAHAVRRDLRESRDRWLKVCGTERRLTSPSWVSVVSTCPDACFVDLTTPDVAAAGMRVVRVLVGDKVLSDDDSLNPRLGGNPTPHPFG